MYNKPQYSFNGLIFILSFCLGGLLSCILPHSSVSNNTNLDSVVKKPQIIFLNYSIKLDKSKGECEIRLINKIIAEGSLKIIRSSPEIKKTGDLECVALDDNLDPVDSIIISDPLNITVEFVNGNNTFNKREIGKDSAQFTVRMQLNEQIRAFGIKKNSPSKNQNSYLLITKVY